MWIGPAWDGGGGGGALEGGGAGPGARRAEARRGEEAGPRRLGRGVPGGREQG